MTRFYSLTLCVFGLVMAVLAAPQSIASTGTSALNATAKQMEKRMAAGENALIGHSVTVKAPPDRIWANWMDVANWPTWDTEIKQSSADAPLGLGVTGKLIPKSGTTSSFKVISFEPQLPTPSYAFQTELPSATLQVTRSLVQQGDGTTFTHEVAFLGPNGPVFASQFGPVFWAALPAVMDNIAAQALLKK